MKTLKKKLKIDGMHCSACAMNIDFDLEDLDGVIQAKTNYAKMETEVEFDEEKVKVELLIETVRTTGYKAQIKE